MATATASETSIAEAALAWDAAQRRVIAAAADASFVVVGAPGSGKTAVVVERMAQLTRSGVDPDAALVLTPTRQSATGLRDRLSLAIAGARSGAPARSVASFAFEIVRAHEVQQGRPAPRLLTGADDDQIVHELLRGDEADEAEGLASRWPEGFGPAVRASRAFRSELRAFIAECTTWGIDAAALAALAERENLPVWRALASFLVEYDDARGALRASHRDAAGLVAEAVALLHRLEHTDPALAVVWRLRVVLVDDAQELTPGGVALLEALHRRGIAVVAFGDPDIGSGAFRGARPEHFSRLAVALGETVVLDEVHRGSAAQTDAVRAVTSRIGAAGVVAHRRAPSGAPTDDSLRVYVARSAVEEHDAIARILRERHLHGGVAWGSCAVIAHDSRQVATLEAELSAREVPARAPGLVEPLGSRGSVRRLLAVVQAAAVGDDEADAADTLFAAGFDPVDLRRLRTALQRAEALAAGTRSPRELLAAAMRDPAFLTTLATRESRRAARVAETLELLRADLRRGASAHELLWTAWSRSGHQNAWATAARGSGPLAEQADRDLDAVVALFQAAKRFGERAEDGGVADPLVFVRGVLDSDVAEDLFSPPSRRERVQVLTPAAALGREFDTVVVAGLQEGVWPNTRLRGTLLQGWRLAEAGLGGAASSTRDRRREVLHDELRLFARALSRSRSRLVVTAVSADDQVPSPLLELLPDAMPAPSRHPLSLRGLVAAHRRTLTAAAAPPAARASAAGQLALMAAARVAGAAPEQWYGVAAPSSPAPLRDPLVNGVRLSPSRLEALETCELDWVIGDLGGDRGSTTAGLGTLLHHAMETAGPDADSLWRAVEERWGELEFEAPWRESAERVRARELVGRLSRYLRAFEAAGGTLLGAESRFEVPLPHPGVDGAQPMVLSGTIDRVEQLADGRVVIVDLKTGRSAPHTDAKVVDNAQLAAYQLALDAGSIADAAGRESAGAMLLALQPPGVRLDYATPTQPPLDEAARAAFLARLERAAVTMSGDTFRAPYETHCRDDHSHGLCRIHTVPPVSAS